MSTQNIDFDRNLEKIITVLSSNTGTTLRSLLQQFGAIN